MDALGGARDESTEDVSLSPARRHDTEAIFTKRELGVYSLNRQKAEDTNETYTHKIYLVKRIGETQNDKSDPFSGRN